MDNPPEAGAGAWHTVRMADLQFNEEQFTVPNAVVRKPSFLAGLVMRLGLARDESSAQKVLLIALVVIVFAIIAINLFSGGSSAPPPPPPIGGMPGA